MATRKYHILRAVFILLAMAFIAPAMGQNTKGDRPLDNQRTVRKTSGKSIKKKGKASTRDIAGRRLRTKNKSSANRANVGIPQPYTTSRQPRRRDDRAARAPINKQYSSREKRRSDPDRQWQGDISGYKPRKIKPSSAEETGRNVYPQRKYTARHPTGDKPFKGLESKTASGRTIVKRTPKRTERAWRGDIKGDPFFPPTSRTGRTNNIHPQKTKYSKYVTKNPSPRDRSYNNRESVAKARRMGTDTGPKNWRRSVMTSSGQKPFVTRGRKNVYWGKTKVGGRANTRDLAGRPLQKRNFRSGGMGLVGRDTLLFFNRKPHGDAMTAKKRKSRFLPGSEAKGGWLNDIAGYRLRKRGPGGAEVAGERGKHYRTSTGYRSNQPIQTKTPGIGASAVERGLRKTGGRAGGNYQDQGGAFTGFLRSKRPGKFSGQARGALWNNNGSPIGAKGVPSSGLQVGRFQGRSRGGKNFNDHGSAYTGDIKGRKRFSDQGEGYSGFLKQQQKKGKFTGHTRALWNNDRTPIAAKGVPLSGLKAGQFQGRSRGGKNYADQGSTYTGDIKGRKQFNDQGGAFTGFIKAKKKPEYSVVSRSGKFWNNNGKAVTEVEATKAGAAAGNFQGRSKFRQDKGKFVATPNKLWNNNGRAVTQLETTKGAALAGNFQGRKKTRQDKHKFLISPDKLWNNNEKAVTQLQTTKGGAAAANFQGRKKTREPEKGKIMTSPNVLWNNNEKATTQIRGTKAGMSAGLYQGKQKSKKPEKYPLNSNTVVWNNNGKATTQIRLSTAGAQAGNFSGRTKLKKESKDRDADIESRMKMKRDYTQNPHSVDEAIKKLKPELNYKAGNFASGAKVNGRRKHNPNSVDDAIDSYHNQAAARRVDYQGNLKMRKFFDRRGESPDAKFVHAGENNVKEDRTIVTNVKLFWSRVFKKSESQPSSLKERSNKMRYDKGEKGMWAD